MPVSKQTTELTFSLRALLYRLRQLLKERQGYSKAKHRELAKLLREGREDFARIKAEDVITNDDLIAALEILELHCEQLHVRANILDHLAFNQGRAKRAVPKAKKREAERGRRRGGATAGQRRDAGGGGGDGGGGGSWSLWNLFGYSASTGSQQSGNVGSEEATVAKSPEDKKTEADDAQDEDGQRQEQQTQEDEDETFIEPELDKSAAVIFYAYPRIPRDITGLPELRAKLVMRWGNDFANRAQDDDPPVKIPDDLVERLRVRRPSQSLVEMYLTEIARSHGIPWGQDDDEEGDDSGGGGGQEQAQANTSDTKPDESDTLQNKAEAKNTPASGDGQVGGAEKRDSQPGNTKSSGKGGGIPEVDELARRFAALK